MLQQSSGLSIKGAEASQPSAVAIAFNQQLLAFSHSHMLVRQDPRNIELMWDQMFRATINYGRKGPQGWGFPEGFVGLREGVCMELQASVTGAYRYSTNYKALISSGRILEGRGGLGLSPLYPRSHGVEIKYFTTNLSRPEVRFLSGPWDKWLRCFSFSHGCYCPAHS